MTLQKTRRKTDGSKPQVHRASAAERKVAAQHDLFEPHHARRYSKKATGPAAWAFCDAANAEYARSGDRVGAIKAGCRAAKKAAES